MSELNACAFANPKSGKWGKALNNLLAREQIFQKFFGSDEMEWFIESEFGDFQGVL